MNSERIKEIQEITAYPESVSVKLALLQVWNECEQESNTQNALLKKELESLKELILELEKIVDSDPNAAIEPVYVKQFKMKVSQFIINKTLPKIF